jgi:1-acyl-sn-glycerol-3-phosphate acyltransferase
MNRIVTMVLKNLFFVPYGYWKLCRYARHPEKYPEQETWNHIRNIMDRAVKSGNIDLTVTGVENIPSQGGFMMYGNHQGMFDVVALAATCPTPMGIVLKKELKDIPFLKQVIACTRSFPMDREDVRQSLTVIQNVTKEVQAGRNYIIFPEGTRSRKGNEMLEFHGGSFRCAVKAKCPIIPFVFIDSFRVLDENNSKPVRAQIHYLKPIPYEEFSGMKASEVAQLVKDRIQAVIDQNT